MAGVQLGRKANSLYMSDTLLVCRYGGYGDHIIWSSLIGILAERYSTLILETNNKGLELFGNDPRFLMVSVWNPESYTREIASSKFLARLEFLSGECKRRGWDFLDLSGTAEESCLATYENGAFMLSQDEREHQYNANLYDHLFKVVGSEVRNGWKHEQTIWYDDLEEEAMRSWRSKNPDMFLIYCVMAGSGQNKIFPTWLQQFCTNLIDTLPRAKIFLFGDQDCTQEVWQYERTISLVHGTTKYPLGFKQALLMTKYADFVFGPETGLLVGAGMMGTPKSMLFTLANKDQVVKYHRNDFSLQSQAGCSPCYTLAYSGLFCPKEDKYGLYPICTDSFDLRQLKRTIVRHYLEWERNHA